MNDQQNPPVAPVGLAFQRYKDQYGQDEFLKLSQMDPKDYHSSLRGSYLSACVHYNMIFGEKCTGSESRASHDKKAKDRTIEKSYQLSINKSFYLFQISS